MLERCEHGNWFPHADGTKCAICVFEKTDDILKIETVLVTIEALRKYLPRDALTKITLGLLERTVREWARYYEEGPSDEKELRHDT